MNYVLVRIVPPADTPIDPAKPPFVVVDPRAGHGPGIGGMKQDSEIGVALAAGHPCYFVGFLPEPVPGQTIEDVCAAEARSSRTVAARHPEAEGKPVIDRQLPGRLADHDDGRDPAGAVGPDPAGGLAALLLGGRARPATRCAISAALLGGTWLTALAGDLGNGIFDGANLVANFESLNPANTYWEKPYNVYSKVDTEARASSSSRPGGAARCCSMPSEMQWIADNLFVGNKLTAGEIRTSDGVRVDLRNIRSPIIVFCSWGDNITPPQQALGWITDLYGRRGRDRRQRPDHRLHAAPDDRPSRHLRLRQGGDQGACRVRLAAWR